MQRFLDLVYAVIQLLIALGNRILGIFRRQSQGGSAPPTPPDDDERVAEVSIQQADQSQSAKEEPMRPSEEGWDPINKKGD